MTTNYIQITRRDAVKILSVGLFIALLLGGSIITFTASRSYFKQEFKASYHQGFNAGLLTGLDYVVAEPAAVGDSLYLLPELCRQRSRYISVCLDLTESIEVYLEVKGD